MNDILNAVKSVINSGKDSFTISDVKEFCPNESAKDIRLWLQNNGEEYGIVNTNIDSNPENYSYNFTGLGWSEPGEFDYSTTNNKELALQRALISTKCTCGINWADIELHINPWLKNESSRIDIIGYNKAECRYYVGEIKFYPEHDTLDDAINQVKDYWKTIKENARVLEKLKFHHTNALKEFSWTNLNDSNTELIVISESTFFKNNGVEIGSAEPTIKKYLSDVSLLNLGDIPEDFFKKQQGRPENRYAPKLKVRKVDSFEDFCQKR